MYITLVPMEELARQVQSLALHKVATHPKLVTAVACINEDENVLFHDAMTATLEVVQRNIAAQFQFRLASSGTARYETVIPFHVRDEHVAPLMEIMDRLGFSATVSDLDFSYRRGVTVLDLKWRERPPWCPKEEDDAKRPTAPDPVPSAYGIFQRNAAKDFNRAHREWAKMSVEQRAPFELLSLEAQRKSDEKERGKRRRMDEEALEVPDLR